IRSKGPLYLRAKQNTHVRPSIELVDQVARHPASFRFRKAGAPAEDRHAARVVGEEHRGLACGVAGTDDVDVEAVRVCGFAACSAVEDTSAEQLIESLDFESPP